MGIVVDLLKHIAYRLTWIYSNMANFSKMAATMLEESVSSKEISNNLYTNMN